MPIENPFLLLGRTTPLCAKEETLQISASGNEILTSKPAMDMVSVQRPDKVLKCPRCQSLDTKFCYFNNYNVEQPRHFCRKCQRYWTAGGSLRNVPVGAGRRKHKSPFNLTSPKSHSEGDDLVSAHFDPRSGIASGMRYPSNKTLDFIPPSVHMGGTQSHSLQCGSAMSMMSHDCHSEAMVHKPATDSSFLHDAQSEMRQKEEGLSSLRHHVSNLDEALHGVQKGPRDVQHRDETPRIEALPDLHEERVEEHVPPPSSSASMYSTLDKKGDIAHPLVWPEQFAKAKASITSESIALQGAYGYGNVSLAWNHPSMWPWLLPYATNNGPVCGNLDQAAVSAVWASAAAAANILQSSPFWNPYGWGTVPMNVNKSEGLSSLGKRPCSPSREQEPLRVPKTLKIGHPEEAMHSSILMTLGLSSLQTSSPASATGFFNADFQGKADVLQHKPTVQLLHHHLEQHRSHMNPAAQARSRAFQERS